MSTLLGTAEKYDVTNAVFSMKPWVRILLNIPDGNTSISVEISCFSTTFFKALDYYTYYTCK